MLSEEMEQMSFRDELARHLGFEFDVNDPFGGLPVVPEDRRREPAAYSNSCYICRDPSFAERGLPLCKACLACGGHVAADDSVCDECKLDSFGLWQTVQAIIEGPFTVFDANYEHLSKLYKDRVPSLEQAEGALLAIMKALTIP